MSSEWTEISMSKPLFCFFTFLHMSTSKTMHSIHLCLVTADIPGAGRFNRDCMSQQMAMETLVADVQSLARIQDSQGVFLRVEHWAGLTFDSSGNITFIDFTNYGFHDSDGEECTEDPPIGPGGSMDLQWIPHTAVSFNVSEQNFIGLVETAKLSRGLQNFDISQNEFFGEFRMDGLPSGLVHLIIQYNRLSGSIVVADIPRGLRKFLAARNEFSGSINLEDLPPGLSMFSVNGNKLHGEISLRHIPEKLKHIDLKGNDFGQEVLVANVAASQAYMRIQMQKFGKIVDDAGTDMAHKFSA